MQLHQIKPIHKTKRGQRVGRGGKRGTYSGKGQKGQKSRAGHKLKPAIRQFIKRYPKLRGYRFNIQGPRPLELQIKTLEKKFLGGQVVSPSSLLKAGIIRKIKGKIPEIKILGNNKISKKFIIRGCKVSQGAKEQVEKAGGNVK